MAERFSDRLRRAAQPIWDAQLRHPFVQEMADGSLDLAKLEFWVRQDYQFLMNQVKVLSGLAAKAPSRQAFSWALDLARSTLDDEMGLHRSYAKEFGISEEALESEPRAPACQGYTDFLLRTAMAEPFELGLAAVLPCFWSFAYKGQQIAKQGLPSSELHARWVGMYSDPGFGLVDRGRDSLDQAAARVDAALRRRMQDAFLLSSRLEYTFLEMCYHREVWPV